MAAAEMGGYNPNSSSVQGVRIPTYTVIDEESFNSNYWPKLENAAKIILNKQPGQPFNLSYEDLFSVAYKCASQQYSERMFANIIEITNLHILSFFSQAEELSAEEYLQAVNLFLAQFCQAVYGLSSIFSYMDRNYVIIRFGRNITSFLNGQLAEKIMSSSKVFDILKQVSDGKLEIDPQIIMSVIKGLFVINPDFAKINMTLFSRFIPNIEPSCRLENLPSSSQEHIHEEISQNNDYERIINKRKVDDTSENITGCRKRLAKSR